jgi:hypothetical protein
MPPRSAAGEFYQTAFEPARSLEQITELHDRRGPAPFECWYGTLISNDCSDQCATWAQPALSLRLGPQVQTLLSREGRPTGGRGAGQSRGRRRGSAGPSGHAGSHASAKAGDAPALEGDHFSWLRPAHADATQSRWKLSGSVEFLALNCVAHVATLCFGRFVNHQRAGPPRQRLRADCSSRVMNHTEFSSISDRDCVRLRVSCPRGVPHG